MSEESDRIERELYDLCQTYRHASAIEILEVKDGFDAIVKYALGLREQGRADERKALMEGAKTAWVDATGFSCFRPQEPFYECLAAYAERPDDSPSWIPVKLLRMEVDKLDKGGWRVKIYDSAYESLRGVCDCYGSDEEICDDCYHRTRGYNEGIREGLKIAIAVAKSKRIALEVREEYGERRLRTTSGYFIAHDFFAEIEYILDGNAEIPEEVSDV